MPLTDAKWIFFDMGYTLVNEDEVHAARAEEVMSTLPPRKSGPYTVEEFFTIALRHGSRGAKSPVASALRELGGKKTPRYNPAGELPYPEAASVLERLHKKYNIGIIASQRGGSVGRLHNYGLLDFIDLVYSSTEVGLDKPHTEFFLSALDAAHCLPVDAVMVGDRPDNDIAPARCAGMMTVRLRQGLFREWNPVDPGMQPDADIDGIASLLPLFDV